VIVEGTDRRPLISTSVRVSPKLRRLRALMPAWPLLMLRREFDGRVEPASDGIWLTKSATLLLGELLSMSVVFSTVTGIGD
jgi:hypothetical protein